MIRARDGLGLACAVAWLVGFGLSMPCEADAQQGWLSVEDTEDLVHARYYEGVPDEELARIGPEGCERLVEMLADPNEAHSHGTILLAIGRCAPAGGLEAIAAWADQPRTGEVDRATFRAWQALPFALAALAERDPRAVARLAAQLEDPAAPEWTFRHHRGARLLRLKHRAAASCLAETGLPEARAALDRAGRWGTDARFRAHLDRMRARHAERSVERARAGQGGRR